MRAYWIRKTHRYLGLIVGVQLTFWALSGLYFSWNNIERVRGEDLASGPDVLQLGGPAILPPRDVTSSLTHEGIESLSLRTLLDEPVYEVKYRADGDVRYALFDATTGAIRSPLGEEEAVAVAERDFTADATIASCELIEEAGKGSEYRGRALPAYRVTFDHPSGTRIYVSADRGMVTARRNNTWRVFDFLWMFHIMDYQARDDINNTILRVLSILGLVTILSGYLLWGFTSPTIRRRRKRAGP